MSFMSRTLGTLGRAGLVATATSAATSVLVGLDKQRGARAALARRHPGPFSPEEREAAVRAYVDALTHPSAAFDVPFAPDCVRVENGIRTGFGGTQMRWDLHLHLQYTAVRAIRGLEITHAPDGREDVIRARFRIVSAFGLQVAVNEDFLVPVADGLIHRVDVRISSV